jgi:hypothetical protein
MEIFGTEDATRTFCVVRPVLDPLSSHMIFSIRDLLMTPNLNVAFLELGDNLLPRHPYFPYLAARSKVLPLRICRCVRGTILV